MRRSNSLSSSSNGDNNTPPASGQTSTIPLFSKGPQSLNIEPDNDQEKAKRMTADRTVHGALLLANFIFGFGSIVGALGISSGTNPLDFTVVREVISGAIMLLIAYYSNGPKQVSMVFPARIHFPAFLRLGFLLFVNQAGYILGIKLAGPVMGSVWNPASPIITAAISIFLGLEPFNITRVAGVCIAFVGCAGMVLLGSRGKSADSAHGGVLGMMVGNGALFLHCCATAAYVLTSKPILQLYSSLAVTAWSYLLASIFMFGAALLSAMIPPFEALICPTCALAPSKHLISIPSASLWALAYFVVFQSVTAWGLVVWSNKYATGTLLLGYTVTQPVTAILFTVLFLLTGMVDSCSQEGASVMCLNQPGIGTFVGVVGVLAGLKMVVNTEPNHSPPPDTDNIFKPVSRDDEDEAELMAAGQVDPSITAYEIV